MAQAKIIQNWQNEKVEFQYGGEEMNISAEEKLEQDKWINYLILQSNYNLSKSRENKTSNI